MKIELHHIEAAIRPQFVWQKSASTMFSTNPKYNHRSQMVGIAVFSALAKLYGYTTEDIALYLGHSDQEIKTSLKWFKNKMECYADGDKRSIVVHTRNKAWLTVNYIRLNYLTKSFVRLIDLPY